MEPAIAVEGVTPSARIAGNADTLAGKKPHLTLASMQIFESGARLGCHSSSVFSQYNQAVQTDTGLFA